MKCFLMGGLATLVAMGTTAEELTLNAKDTGYRGIWFMDQPSNDEYVYKYSGGLGTYCESHRPFAVYSKKVDKTFFCYGGTTGGPSPELLHMVSYFDHKTGMVPRPTLLLNKHTDDAHDNPVISMDEEGYIWIFSTAHGTGRPSYIHRSKTPYNVDAFELIRATRPDGDQQIPITNFSYMQVWHVPQRGFVFFFTCYDAPAFRTNFCATSRDGISWDTWTRISAIEEGHYQISAVGKKRAGTAFNYHPNGKGLNWRTNLYYMESPDFGHTWTTADGRVLDVPLTEVRNTALLKDYASEGLNVYMKDIVFDNQDRPVILYVTSKGYASGPQNDPRTWRIAHWNGPAWDFSEVTTSDNNYDTGSLYLESSKKWRIIAPTQTGAQPYNPGGEMAMWISNDAGKTWHMEKQLTHGSPRNHTYARRPVDAHPDFYALWADGNARKPSESSMYFSTKSGDVYRLPREMHADFERPEKLTE